jgi:hypothetical protein
MSDRQTADRKGPRTAQDKAKNMHLLVVSLSINQAPYSNLFYSNILEPGYRARHLISMDIIDSFARDRS